MNPAQEITAKNLMAHKPGESIIRTCEICGTSFEFTPHNELEAKYVSHCSACWKAVEEKTEADYRATVIAAQDKALLECFPQELREPFDQAKCPNAGLWLNIELWKPDAKHHSLYIFGPNGIGKTRMSVALAMSLRMDAGFHSWPVLAAEIQNMAGRNLNNIAAELIRPGLLVLDDFLSGGSGRDREHLLAYNIINGRDVRKRPTIITSNTAPKEIHCLADSHLLRAVESRISYGYSKKGIN